MSYCTEYYLTASNLNGSDIPALNQALEAVCDLKMMYGSDWSGCETWYDHEEDMRKISSMFPDVLFTLSGAGEDYTDLWIKHFRNGKMQLCPARISYDAFDPAKLT